MKKITTGEYRLTRDEAAKLCIHHIRLAIMFFESTPEDINHLLSELSRQMYDEGTKDHELGYRSAIIFLQHVASEYEALKDRDI